MRKFFSGYNPIEIIFDVFIVLAIFVTLGMIFIIMLQSINSNREIMEISSYLLGFS